MGNCKRSRFTLLGNINQNYVYISNKMSDAYTQKMGFYCDIYFPHYKKSPEDNGEYINTNIFEPHQSACYYEDDPDIRNVKFYIPYLLKRENMNSDDLEFDSMYLEESDTRPFIEGSKKDELPIQSKVVVHIGESLMYFFVDAKRVVNGASGHMLLRQYLAPLENE